MCVCTLAFLSPLTLYCRSSVQLVVARVALAFTVMPEVPLHVPLAQQVRGLPQARPRRLDALRGTPMACHPATSPATVPAVRDSPF